MGEGSAPGLLWLGCSTPPLKKKVTWAYFSVSRDAELFYAVLAQVFAQGIFQRLRLISHMDIREGLVILRHGDEIHREVFPRKAGEFRIDEGAGDLPGPVGAEIEEDDRIILFTRATGWPF